MKVDDRVEDEWDSIYVDCQDGYDSIAPITSNAPVAPSSTPTAIYADVRRGSGAKGLDVPGPSSFDLYGGVDEEEGGRGYEDDDMMEGEGQGGEEAAESEGFDDEDIIDCAIKGRWTFDNNDDPVRTSGDSPEMCCAVPCRAIQRFCSSFMFRLSKGIVASSEWNKYHAVKWLRRMQARPGCDTSSLDYCLFYCTGTRRRFC